MTNSSPWYSWPIVTHPILKWWSVIVKSLCSIHVAGSPHISHKNGCDIPSLIQIIIQFSIYIYIYLCNIYIYTYSPEISQKIHIIIWVIPYIHHISHGFPMPCCLQQVVAQLNLRQAWQGLENAPRHGWQASVFAMGSSSFRMWDNVGSWLVWGPPPLNNIWTRFKVESQKLLIANLATNQRPTLFIVP